MATNATTWLALNTTGNTRNLALNGVVNDPVLSPDHLSGMRMLKPLRTWASPMVTTARMRRGARLKRRMISTSTSAPRTSAMTSPQPTARK